MLETPEGSLLPVPELCIGRGGVTGTWQHCCVLGNTVCSYLVENTAGRRWACGLFVELGSWDAVEADPRYEPIATYFDNPRMCREWQPKPGSCCREVRHGDLG